MNIATASNYSFEKVDIRNLDELSQIYEGYIPTDIIHFAAESHVDNSISNPIIFTETNIMFDILQFEKTRNSTSVHSNII